MADSTGPEIGSIAWTDLTVGPAEAVRDFYAGVVGWKPASVDMQGYNDFVMAAPESGRAIAGVCHARGSNDGLPAQWLIYIVVADLERSAARCEELGGKVLVKPKGMGGYGRYCVIEDPAGAVAALFQPVRGA
jgi:predicted enzyme related to lactoylglutathione lyase